MIQCSKEFRTWLLEEKLLNPETTSQDQMKKLFKEYVLLFRVSSVNFDQFEDSWKTIIPVCCSKLSIINANCDILI
jgi:hypothetical protein